MVLAGRERHTITTYLRLTGATTVKHFSRFYVFLGGTLYQARWVPLAAPIVLEVDDLTKKKVGTHIQGVARYRNGAGSARQEYRTLRGLNFVWGIMRVPLAREIVACVVALLIHYANHCSQFCRWP